MTGNCGECTRRWFCNENPKTCGAFPELPPPTNADRIRGMSDEELARLIYSFEYLDAPDYCQRKKECDDMLDSNTDIPAENCVQCLFDWLQQPAEKGENDVA